MSDLDRERTPRDVEPSRMALGAKVHTPVAVLVWIAGVTSVIGSIGLINGKVVNVVTYEFHSLNVPYSVLPLLSPFLLILIVVYLGLGRQSRNQPAANLVGSAGAVRCSAISAALPLAAPVMVWAFWLSGGSPTFPGLCLVILGVAWSITRLGAELTVPVWSRQTDRIAYVVLAVAIAVSTFWHAGTQVVFWKHFMLGYADFGFFTTELEHCLFWKEVGPARFADTRMGYHWIPLFYLLVPFYAMARSPVFLMVVGSLALNLAALPFYHFAKHRSGSGMIGLMVGLSWLVLPSVSRLPYSSTYGFQSIYLAVPFLACALTLGLRGRWRASHLCLVAALLCEETVCGVAVGWGAYLFIWGGRRRDGIWIVILSLCYLLLCTLILIPNAANSSQYSRLALFGELTMGGLAERLTRPRVPLYLLALTLPLIPTLYRRWRLLIAAVPPLLLVLVLGEHDYLNIKFWHHSSFLVVLFAAAAWGCTTPRRGEKTVASLGPPMGMLLAAIMFHQWLGFSPLAQAHRIFAASPSLHSPDPRMDVVDYVRRRFSPKTTTIIATERMAAHFTDYRMVYPATDERLEDRSASLQVLVVDRSDGWDKIVRSGRTDDFLANAQESGFVLKHSKGPVVVLSRSRSARLSKLLRRSFAGGVLKTLRRPQAQTLQEEGPVTTRPVMRDYKGRKRRQDDVLATVVPRSLTWPTRTAFPNEADGNRTRNHRIDSPVL